MPVSPELLLLFAPIACAFLLIMIILRANVANMMLARGLARQRKSESVWRWGRAGGSWYGSS